MLQSRLIVGSLLFVFFSSLIIKNKQFNNLKIILLFLLISILVIYSFNEVQKFKSNLIVEKKIKENSYSEKEINIFSDKLENEMSLGL